MVMSAMRETVIARLARQESVVSALRETVIARLARQIS